MATKTRCYECRKPKKPGIKCPCKERTMKRMISGSSLRNLIQWYRGRTHVTQNKNSAYEQTICALEELGRYRWPKAQITEKQVAIEEEDPLPELNERQMLILYVVGEGRFDLLDASKAANVKTIEQLVELEVLDDWRRITDLGCDVLQKAKR